MAEDLGQQIALVSRALPDFQFEVYRDDVMVTSHAMKHPGAMDVVVDPRNAPWLALVEVARVVDLADLTAPYEADGQWWFRDTADELQGPYPSRLVAGLEARRIGAR